ncbi:hypothetical protein [Chromobacterium haemolyticum]|uniref:hypothetical protein n=1 Tax=Chromobacterium haemolyticum TaxID=394935 RepID=UPI00244825FD|nr:hypothetical protein [Chromobacterium haemolyticum]MDH0342021.1 hypothetical protein [Chromobacterium haemolyticum]
MQTELDNQKRLEADHFIALRSLARRRWLQGEKIEWKFNREWRSVTYWDVPALDVVYRLITMDLVEDIECSCGCRRDVFQLTEKGKAFVDRMNSHSTKTDAGLVEQLPIQEEKPPQTGWLNWLRQAFSTR